MSGSHGSKQAWRLKQEAERFMSLIASMKQIANWKWGGFKLLKSSPE